MSNKILHLIYLRTGEMLLSKKEYSHWEEIQDEYEHYMTDLAFDSCEDLISFFELDFGDECCWLFSKYDSPFPSPHLKFAESEKLNN